MNHVGKSPEAGATISSVKQEKSFPCLKPTYSADSLRTPCIVVAPADANIQTQSQAIHVPCWLKPCS